MEYIVGKPKFKTALLYVSGWIMFLIFLKMIGNTTWWEKELNIVFIFIVLVLIIIVLPGLTYAELMWKVNKDVIQYTYHDTMFIKIKAYFKHILRKHHLEYQMTINMNQIDYIAVTYTKIPRPPFGTLGYDILFEIHMYDGSIYSFLPLPLEGKKPFIEAVTFIQQQGIQFKDRYHILSELLIDRPISYYLEKIDKENTYD